MHPASTENLQVRPFFRILGAVFMLLMATLMIHSAIPLFSAEQIVLPSCASERKASSQFLCEIDKAMRSKLPAQMQGPLEAFLHLVMTAFLCVCHGC